MTTNAIKAAEDRRSAADEKKAEATERQAAINEIDATFREEVKAAADKRAAAMAELPGESTNMAETAWNETKSEEDPLYADLAMDFRAKVDVAFDAIKTTGNADIAGLEDFEARVKELLAEEKEATEGETKTKAATGSSSAKSGKLPDDFPHRQALADAGYDTYAKVRGLKGDYSEVGGVGEARGKEIDAAL